MLDTRGNPFESCVTLVKTGYCFACVQNCTCVQQLLQPMMNGKLEEAQMTVAKTKAETLEKKQTNDFNSQGESEDSSTC